MKALKIIFVLLLTFVQLTSCNKADDPNPANASHIKFNVSLPDGWEYVNGSVLEHQYLKGTASFMIKEETVLNNMQLNEAVEKAMEVIGSSFDNVSFSEPISMQIDGNDALSITFSYAISVGNTTIYMKMQSIYLLVNQKCQLISFGDQEQLFDRLDNDITFILANIKIIKT